MWRARVQRWTWSPCAGSHTVCVRRGAEVRDAEGLGHRGLGHACAAPSSSPGALPPPFRLQQVKVQVVENSVCDQQYHNASRHRHADRRVILDDMLCAGSEGRDSCYVSPSPPPAPVSAPGPIPTDSFPPG